MEENFVYTKLDILRDLGLKAGTFYNRIKELGIMDNELYMKKVKENNRDKVYFNQLAFDKIRECQESVNNVLNRQNNTVNNVSMNDTIPKYMYDEIVKMLNQQIEDKDKQIENFINMLSVKDEQIEKFQKQHENFQILIKEKEEKIAELGTAEDNKRWYQFWKK